MENLTINLQKLRKTESMNIQPFFDKIPHFADQNNNFLFI